MRKNIYVILFILGVWVPGSVLAQQDPRRVSVPPATGLPRFEHWKNRDSLFTFVKPVVMVQTWAVYTMGQKAQLVPPVPPQNGSTAIPGGPLEEVGDRVELMFRRARLGFTGRPYPNLSYALMLFYDNMGRSRYSAVKAGQNDFNVGIWDAFFTLRLSQRHDLLHLTAGFFRPQMSRENITSAFSTTSLEKAMSQTTIRQHLTGTNPGRATGLNLGGLRHRGLFGINYNVGLFDNLAPRASSISTDRFPGPHWSPVVVGRVAFTLGNPELERYQINYLTNFMSTRRGITLAVAGSHQGQTNVFLRSQAAGFDVLANYGPLNLDGEYQAMVRERAGVAYHYNSWHARASYNVVVAGRFFLEPVVMLYESYGEPGTRENVLGVSGLERGWDLGLNWYVNRRDFKVALHYTKQDGYGNNVHTDGRTFEQGDYLGLGLTLIF